jgi:hypothetical protein
MMDGKTISRAEASATSLAALDWTAIGGALDGLGYATLPGLLTPQECHGLAALYAEDARFRQRIVMERHAFGQGEYKYFAYPLPELVARLRQSLYPGLAAIANGWRAALGEAGRFPPTLAAYLEECHAAGQTRPTPLLLKYAAGGYNCLHQDLYGEHVFPLQLTILLSEPGRDFTGGEFLLVEQRPRAQSKGEAIALAQGEAILFPVRHRPARGTRGFYRLTLRHGVSRIRSGHRTTLGIIFHDAA